MVKQFIALLIRHNENRSSVLKCFVVFRMFSSVSNTNIDFIFYLHLKNCANFIAELDFTVYLVFELHSCLSCSVCGDTDSVTSVK